MNNALIYTGGAITIAWIAGIVVLYAIGHSADVSGFNGVMTGLMGVLIVLYQRLNHAQAEKATDKANEAANAAVVGVQQNESIMDQVADVKKTVESK